MGSYTVERNATIEAPAEKVHALIEDFHLWPQWSPWEDLDPDLQRTYSGAEKGVGAHYAWTGNKKAGAGSMEITGSSPTGIDLDLNFLKPFKSSSKLRFSLTPVSEGSTNVNWRLDGETTGLLVVLGRFMNFDKMVGPDFEKGLTRLKAVAESSEDTSP